MALDGSNGKEVIVLLSTYNGSKYLKQQLDSLYQQTYPNIRILVRDDGSNDSTRSILKNEEVKGCLTLLDGHQNLGVASSFFELLKNVVPIEAGYIAFCDQDDIWHAEKITRAVSKLARVTGEYPAMYCSRAEIVDAHLKHIGYTMQPRKIGFGNALVDCISTGCTIVLNSAAVQLLGNKLPNNGVMHDWWCYLVMSCFGEVIYDSTATLMYRQHANNTIGLDANGWAQFNSRCQRFFGKSSDYLRMSTQASFFLEIYQDRIPASKREVLNNFIVSKSSWCRRLQLVFSCDIWRQKKLDNLLLRLLIMLNRF